MLRLLLIIFIFAFIEKPQVSNASVIVYDIKASEERAIVDVEAKSQDFTDKVEKLKKKFIKLTKEVQAKAKPSLDNFRTQLSKISGFFEDTIEKFTALNVSKETCGLVGFREFVMTPYDVGQNCWSKMMNIINREMNNLSYITTRISEQFELTKSKIRNCKNVEKGNENIGKCIVAQSKKEKENLKSLSKVSVQVRKAIQPYEATIVLSRCLAEEGTQKMTQKINNITFCLSKKVPGFTRIGELIRQYTSITEQKMLLIVDRFSNVVMQYLKNIERKLMPIAIDIDIEATKIEKAIAKFILTVKDTFKNIWNAIIL